MGMRMKNYDIVILGNYTKDTIVSAVGTRYVDGGGFNYGAHAAKVSGLSVAAVTRLAREDFRVVEKLEKIGVDVYPFETPTSTHMKLEYPTDDVDQRILTCTATAGTYTTDQFEDFYSDNPIKTIDDINQESSEDIMFRILYGKKSLVLKAGPSFAGLYVDIFAEDDFLASTTLNKNGEIHLNKDTRIFKRIDSYIQEDKEIIGKIIK